MSYMDVEPGHVVWRCRIVNKSGLLKIFSFFLNMLVDPLGLELLE